MELIEFIKMYYEGRDLKYPDIWESLGWATAELGEVYEILLAQKGGWVRNNPENHTKFTDQDLEEELGDVVMMIMMAGYTRGLNPIKALKDKLARKLAKSEEDKTSREESTGV